MNSGVYAFVPGALLLRAAAASTHGVCAQRGGGGVQARVLRVRCCLQCDPTRLIDHDMTVSRFLPSDSTDVFSAIPYESDALADDAVQGDYGSGGKGGDDGSGKGGKDDGGDDEEMNELLKGFGVSREQLPRDLQQLSSGELRTFLRAVQGGLPRMLSRAWPGWRRRMAADATFAFKIAMELTVGLGLAASGMIAARGERILEELDFALCDIAVGGTLNFILVYLLAPVVGAKGGVLAALPSNVFSHGQYSMAQRAGGFVYKGALFGACGFAGSVVGTTVSQGLIALRGVVAKLRGSSALERELPNVVVNSMAWAGFMVVSSNPRYQAVAGMERALFALCPQGVAKVGSAALRTGNNVLGGAVWVWWARAIGLQKAAP